ncbi:MULTISPECIES: hypothetical protein [unclassified Gilliamella]|uniref:hypothetical protein n=1 Tax=unclassified Gilliamella TaxID=2685620 RepID=UPI00130769F7|nr:MULTISPECIES: hypothetical protein [unclassified Gilliamella]MWP49542.1 hypothetical protein [Gilliamella sp. Lep-s35]MWP69178.1 hypothetical protein [Gilliamella sp. Lep-s5]MWP77533.1 hypothetical protein [Gilliamella sp. Lep-s21]
MSQESPLFNALALTIKQVTPTLEKDEKIYAHQIVAVSDAGRRFTLKERRGLPMQKYVGQKLQCIIEILDAQFFFPANKKEIDALPATTLKGIYQWKETGYKFIPELIRMVEGALDDEDHDYDEDEYEEKAPEYFANWGEFGLGLDIYQTKPMIKMGNGVCLLNEYCQEELIDEWEYGQELYFMPKTLLLRGIHTGKLKYNPIALAQT